MAAPPATKPPSRVRPRYVLLAAAAVGALAIGVVALDLQGQPQAPPAATTSPFGEVDCAGDQQPDSSLGLSTLRGGVTLGPKGDRTFDLAHCSLNADDKNARDLSYAARQFEFLGRSAALTVDKNVISAQYCKVLLHDSASKLETTIFVTQEPTPGLCVRTSDGGLAVMIVRPGSVQDDQIGYDFATWPGAFGGPSGTPEPTTSADSTVP